MTTAFADAGSDADGRDIGPPSAPFILQGDPDLFRSSFDSRAYRFAHRLAEHPLFDFRQLLELTRLMARNPEDVFYDAGEVGIGQRWDEVPPSALSPDDLLERIETAGAWIVLRRADKFPGYAELLDRAMSEIEILSGRDIDSLMSLKTAIIFINSPGRITSYHIDRECNWLLQIAGEKTVHVFDKDDRTVLPEEEIERFWMADNNSAVYKPQFEHRAKTFLLRPGEGVHIPVGSPHWVRNGRGASVSLSINFHYKESHRGDLYRANYLLRRLGLTPAPPGLHPLRDAVKRQVFRPVLDLRGYLTRRQRQRS